MQFLTIWLQFRWKAFECIRILPYRLTRASWGLRSENNNTHVIQGIETRANADNMLHQSAPSPFQEIKKIQTNSSVITKSRWNFGNFHMKSYPLTRNPLRNDVCGVHTHTSSAASTDEHISWLNLTSQLEFQLNNLTFSTSSLLFQYGIEVKSYFAFPRFQWPMLYVFISIPIRSYTHVFAVLLNHPFKHQNDSFSIIKWELRVLIIWLFIQW
jgi:hypothetical protein